MLGAYHMVSKSCVYFPLSYKVKLLRTELCSSILFVAVQLLSHVRLLGTPWTAAHQASLSVTISWSLVKLISIESMMPCNHLILCPSFLLMSLIFPRIRLFYNESALCIRWPKCWSFSFSISPSNPKYSRLISFWIDWFYLLAVQRTLKNTSTV